MGGAEPSGSLTSERTATPLLYSLQASRHGNDRDGRLYTITVSAFDDEGNEGQRPPASLCRMIRGRVGASPRASVPQACPPGPSDGREWGRETSSAV